MRILGISGSLRAASYNTALLRAAADLAPDGQRVAYSWQDDAGAGWVRFVDTSTGEATAAARVCTPSLA